MIMFCWIDILFRRKTTVRFWFSDNSKQQITFNTRQDKRDYFKLYNDKINAYQVIPTNKSLAKFWDKF
jgi:hypothetical protein